MKVYLICILAAAAAILSACGGESEDPCSGLPRAPERSGCYSELAAELGDASLCSRVEGADALRESCVAKIAIAGRSLELCGGIEGEKTRGYCISRIAVMNEDLSVCEGIGDLDWKDVCYRDVSNLTGSREPCGRISRASVADECYDANARATGSGCGFIRDGLTRDRCILRIAEQAGDPDLCGDVKTLQLKWRCYLNAARQSGDAEICGRINFEPVRENCRDAVKETQES